MSVRNYLKSIVIKILTLLFFLYLVYGLVSLCVHVKRGWIEVQPHRVRNVLDGDTIVLENGQVVRYFGIDAPDKNCPYQDIYKTSVEFNKNLVLYQYVYLELRGVDHYGRLLADVYLIRQDKKIFVQEEIIKNGLAWVYQKESFFPKKQQLLEAQKNAFKNKVGIWSLKLPDYPYYVITKYRFHLPDCPYLKEIKQRYPFFKGRRIYRKEEAILRGLSPCRTCNPLFPR